ncbi:MAG TPA: hypothetical protein VJ951_03755 [Bacteroidales bacterium]|nr:hypothetical protein [Bacteroidales bacterium]
MRWKLSADYIGKWRFTSYAEELDEGDFQMLRLLCRDFVCN